MARSWFSQPLETVATWWRIERTDGVTLGFSSHDRDLVFAGLVHRTAPGMVPSAIRRSATLEADSAEVSGALSHDAIREADLAAGRFDGARVSVGLVDWETLETEPLYAGTIGAVSSEGAGFSAELQSLKADLAAEIVPRTAPTCRAEFCGSGCTLSGVRFSHEARVLEIDAARLRIRTDAGTAPANFAFGGLRWLGGAECGLQYRIVAVEADWLMVDRPVSGDVVLPQAALLREGCDHTIGTCAERFANAVNFQGEPYLPGNDLLTSYPSPVR